MGKSKAHQTYHTQDGIKVPGVTTILGIMAKPALVGWANRLGLEGIEVGKYVDNLADIGTLAHAMIEAHFKGEKFNSDDYSKNQIDKAENSVLKFYEWEKQHNIKVIGTELQLVSQEHGFGGTCDLVCELDGVPTLIDFKTCKAIYDEAHTQACAYAMLLAENGKPVEQIKILRIGRDETEGFEDITITKESLHIKRFLACLEVYNINKQLKKKE